MKFEIFYHQHQVSQFKHLDVLFILEIINQSIEVSRYCNCCNVEFFVCHPIILPLFFSSPWWCDPVFFFWIKNSFCWSICDDWHSDSDQGISSLPISWKMRALVWTLQWREMMRSHMSQHYVMWTNVLVISLINSTKKY